MWPDLPYPSWFDVWLLWGATVVAGVLLGLVVYLVAITIVKMVLKYRRQEPEPHWGEDEHA